MTITPSPTATEGRTSLTSAPDAAPLHAYAAEGGIMLLDCGRYRPATRWQAVAVVADLQASPIPSSQERARQIRAVLKETMQ